MCLMLLLLVVPTVVAENESCSQRVVDMRETRAASNMTITVGRTHNPTLCQKPDKLTVGSTLLVVSMMAVGACIISLSFGKLSVSCPNNYSYFLGHCLSPTKDSRLNL